MKKFICVMTITLMVSATSVMPQFPGRLAASHDGNIHDKDDIGALAFVYAMAWAYGRAGDIVHIEHSNHLGLTGPQEKEMIESAEGGAQRFGVPASAVFNAFQNSEEAVANFKKEAEKSTADDRLTMMCAGPMEQPWRNLNAVDVDKRKFVTMISHSSWNDTHQDTPELKHRWTHLGQLPGGAKMIHIQNPSSGLNKGTCGDWNPLKNMEEKFQWLWERQNFKCGDVSDARVMWYILTGSQAVKPSEVIDKFKNPDGVVNANKPIEVKSPISISSAGIGFTGIGTHEVRVMNVKGEIIYAKTGTGLDDYSFAGLPTGLYLVKASGAGLEKTKRIFIR